MGVCLNASHGFGGDEGGEVGDVGALLVGQRVRAQHSPGPRLTVKKHHNLYTRALVEIKKKKKLMF